MKRIYIDKANIVLKVEKQRLLIKKDKQNKGLSVPCSQIEAIIIMHKTVLSSSLLLQLRQKKIDIICLHPRDHDISVFCGGFEHGNYQRTFDQITLLNDMDAKLNFAKNIVRYKLQQQKKTLRSMCNRRQHNKLILNKCINSIDNALVKIKNETKIEGIRGLEGSGAKAYFTGLKTVLPKILGFTGRKKRPPPDPVNSLLSLGYTLIHSESVRALLSSGLDPRFGVLHENAYNRQSLACDLMELFRAKYDYIVWRWFAEQVFRERDFYMNQGACFLSKEARNRFYSLYEHHAKRLRRSQKYITTKWAQQLDNKAISQKI